MNNMTICNYIVGIVGIILGGLIMNGASAFPREFTVNGPGPGFWPFSLGCAMLMAAVWLLLYTFYKKADLRYTIFIKNPSFSKYKFSFSTSFVGFLAPNSSSAASAA